MLVRKPCALGMKYSLEDPFEEAIMAMQYRRLDDLVRYVNMLPSAAMVDSSQENLLHKCVRVGDASSMRQLLTWPRNPRPGVDVRNVRGETPMRVAIHYLTTESSSTRRAAAEFVGMLIDAGARPFLQDERGDSPMSLVGGIPNCPASVFSKLYHSTARHVSHEDLPKVLLGNAWPIAATFHFKDTELTKRMLERSPDVINPRNGKKPNEMLHMALEAGSSPDMLEVLLSFCGLDVNSSYNGQTPLHVAARMNVGNSYYDHIRILLAAGANPNSPNKQGLRPIHYTVQNSNPQVFELLLSAGSEPPCEDDQTKIPHGIHFAAANGHISIIRYMLTESNIHYRCYNGLTPLHYAARNRQAAAVYYLLAAGAKVNEVDFKGWTPLHHAVAGPDSNTDATQVIGLLLHFGANVDVVSTVEKHTALNEALAREDHRSMFLLVRHIALQGSRSKQTLNEIIIEKHDGLYAMYKRCLQELMRLSECSAAHRGDYLHVMKCTREELTGIATGNQKVGFLKPTPEGGVRFVPKTFSAASFPIYGNYFLNRIHHANLEYMTLEEVALVQDFATLVDVLALSAHEFVEFFSPECLI